jgi:aspartyl aminopeptidase
MPTATPHESDGLLEYIDASPSPYHACSEVARHLAEAGFRALEEIDAWELAPGGHYVVRGGSVVAWHLPADWSPDDGFRILGAHTDSPNLRIKPRPDVSRGGFRQLGVEVYGGVLLGSWLDRDLGLSGRVFVRGADGAPEGRLLRVDRPVLRVPQLAIHLNRDVNTEGLKLNPQQHMTPVWGVAGSDVRDFRELVATELDVEADEVLSWELMCHDVQPSRRIGWHTELISAPRLDNLCSCWVGLRGLLESLGNGGPSAAPVLSLFDHEEVGSGSRGGAGGPVLRDLLERVVLARGGGREDYHRALAASVCVSADMAHATHPNYIEKHEPEHHLRMNAGPVIKINSNLRYASEGETEALFQLACERADVPYQKWVNRADLACGSTIGPLTAAKLGIRTVDVGLAQLAMHSAREMCGAEDPGLMVRALAAFFASS